MLGMFSKKSEEADELVDLAVARAENLYDKHKLCCSESILVMMNEGFGGSLTAQTAKQIGAGFCHGMCGAGCSCGALSGAIAALGLFLGHHSKDGLRRKKFQKTERKMHDQFKERFSSTCCRVLTKKVKHDRKAHHENCLNLTRGGAEIAVRLLLEARPALMKEADREFLQSTKNVS